MQITSAQIRNFRILQSINIDLEEDLTLVIGKNNSGKTSFLAILQKFLSDNDANFSFEDFSINAQAQILTLESKTILSPEDFVSPSISLKLYISYSEDDDIGIASSLLLDLDAKNSNLIVLFEYALEYEKYLKLYKDFNEYKGKGINRGFSYFIQKNINKYFSVRIKALEFGNETNFKPLEKDVLKSIISLKIISAKRDVDNEQGHSKALSALAGKYYNENIQSETEFPDLQNQLQTTDEKLSEIYHEIFATIIKEVAEMSYNPSEAELSIISTLSEKRIFQDNTTVKYKHGGTLLPEDYNGLGYLNLFAILFNIRINLDKLSKKNKPDEIPTPLNILFIEEPEAHTHPQMQYIFINNIKDLIHRHCSSSNKKLHLQTIISTHSSHIVSQGDFKDIRYFSRDGVLNVQCKNLKDLYLNMVTSSDPIQKATEEQAYRFVKQYVTLNRAELFFADKAVLIEGDTERILLSAMMKKIDDENKSSAEYLPLLSQNISIIEVGAYSHIFATFLGFLNIKTLIITDLDCAKLVDGKMKKCSYLEGTDTTNGAIKYFTNVSKLKTLSSYGDNELTFHYDNEQKKWVKNKDGSLRICYQSQENGYTARSFEDSFICLNIDFINQNKKDFVSLKCRSKLDDETLNYYVIANECIDSKTTFALDILLFGGSNQENWNIPSYIKAGLIWIGQ